MKIESGLSTLARETREINGSDFNTNHEQTKIEKSKREELIKKDEKGGV